MSIEQFAAYIDGNLPHSEMQAFQQMAREDVVLRQLLETSTAIDETIAGFSDVDLQLPQAIAGSEFEMPEIDDAENNSSVGDRYTQNDVLYIQRDTNGEENSQQGENHSSLVDEIFEEMDNDATVDENEMFMSDIDADMDMDVDDFDDDFMDDIF